MKYIDIYNEMKDPFLSEETLNKLAEIYSNRKFDKGDFYSGLVKATKKEYPKMIDEEEVNNFHVKLFNQWKNSIVALTKEEYQKLKQQKSYDSRLIKLKEALEQVPNIKTYWEEQIVLEKLSENKELDEALKLYHWQSRNKNSCFFHVKSRELNARKEPDITAEHRLYLNLDTADIHKVAIEIMNKCEERKLPYYFKFDETGRRDDSIVLYSDTKNLPKYISILKEIGKEYPEIKNRSKQPPLLTGKIDRWIGYGAEPDIKDNKRQSFNGVRSRCIEKAIEIEYESWLKTHKDQKRDIVIQLAKLGTTKYFKNLGREYIKKLESGNIMYVNGKDYDLETLTDEKFMEEVFLKLEWAINSIVFNPENNIKDIVLKPHDVEMVITEPEIKNMRDLLVPELIKEDFAFRNKVRQRIKALSKEEGIDINNYCFNHNSKAQLIEQDKIQSQLPKLRKVQSQPKESNVSSQIREEIFQYFPMNSPVKKKYKR